jgi:myo-inositol 2-dehydrogenase/D-chiro-inositol 1-dehydrogenase
MSSTETKVLNYAIIGTGAMGLEHIRNLKLIANTKVVAIADGDARAREEASELLEAGTFACLSNWEDLLLLDNVDAVIVATPNYTHVDLLRKLIPWKKAHLYVEKPMCTTMADCLEVQRLVEEHMPLGSGRIYWVGMEYRYMPPIAKMLGVIDSGALGQLRMVHIREHRFPFLLKVADWNRFAVFTGGTLVEKCCHFWDLMRRIIGPGAKAVSVYASGAMDVNHVDERYDRAAGTLTDSRQPDIVDNAFAVVNFEGGIRGCLDLCMFAEDRQHEEVSVVGSKGKVHAEAPACVVTHHTPTQRASGANASNPRIPPLPRQYEENTTVEATPVDESLLEAGFHEGATFFSLSAFAEAVQDGKPPAVDVADGLAAVAMGVAAELSIKENRLVMLDEVMDGLVSVYPDPEGASSASSSSSSGSSAKKASSSSGGDDDTGASSEKRRKLGGGASWSTA